MFNDSLLSQEKSSLSSSIPNKFCLNTYEQQLEIDGRINQVMKALVKTDDLRNQTEAIKNKVNLLN